MSKKKQKELPLSSMVKYAEANWSPASPHIFFRWIFPMGELDVYGAYTSGKYCGIAVTVHYADVVGKKIKTTARRHWIYDDLSEVDALVDDSNDDFTLLNGISYAGKTRKAKNARYCYAIIIDVDYIKRTESSNQPGDPIGLVDMEHQIHQGFLPEPTALVLSGSGIHVYYILDTPVPMFQKNVQELQKLKDALTRKWWMHGLVQSVQSVADVQIQSVHQAFRMPGTKTKDGRRATAWWLRGEKTTIDELNQYVDRKDRAIIDMSNTTRHGATPMAAAKEQWPEWYQRRVIEGRPRQTWVCNRSVYDWWLQRLRDGATAGHRYWCVMVLAVYGIKCQIPKAEVEADAMGLVRYLDGMTTEQDNHFSEQDVKAAMKAYNPDYITYPIHAITARTGIQVEKNKRNYRKQSTHLILARTMQHTRAMLGEDVLGGRPKGSGTKRQQVHDYFVEHPGASVIQASQELGISRPTVYKWRDS